MTPNELHELLKQVVRDNNGDDPKIQAAIDKLFSAEAELLTLGFTCLSDPYVLGLLAQQHDPVPTENCGSEKVLH